jgi:hypothetical protein
LASDPVAATDANGEDRALLSSLLLIVLLPGDGVDGDDELLRLSSLLSNPSRGICGCNNVCNDPYTEGSITSANDGGRIHILFAAIHAQPLDIILRALTEAEKHNTTQQVATQVIE